MDSSLQIVTSDNESIARFLGWVYNPDELAWEQHEPHLNLHHTLLFDKDWNALMLVVRKINTLAKEIQFAIFKTYVSCTVEKNSKFRKDFAFSYAEYITAEQTDIQATYKLVVRFVNWYKTANV